MPVKAHKWIASGNVAILRRPYGMCTVYTEAALNDAIDSLRKNRAKCKSEIAYMAELEILLDGLQVFAKERRK